MMIIDFTPMLYLLKVGMLMVLAIAAGGIIACLSTTEREAVHTWVETQDFLRSLRLTWTIGETSRRHLFLFRRSLGDQDRGGQPTLHPPPPALQTVRRSIR